MQKKINFSSSGRIDLEKPIDLRLLKNKILAYFMDCCSSGRPAVVAYNIVLDQLDLEKAVKIINRNNLELCEKELTEVLRMYLIPIITLIAASEKSEFVSNSAWDNPVENELLKGG